MNMVTRRQRRRDFCKTVGFGAAALALSPKVSAEENQASPSPPAAYDEPYRPQFHFTPPQGWMNDPCGMVYHEGEYHLHYQANPNPKGWGDRWAHAVSKDLVHWEHRDPALIQDEKHGGCWSGAAAVDTNNTAGFQTGKEKVIVLFFTKVTKAQGQTVGLAYSNDRGRSWQRYPDNPVIIPSDGNKDFRDPNVIWHEPSKKWILVISRGYTAQGDVYQSTDLKQWEHIGKAPNGECPDMFELPLPGKKEKKWLYVCGDYPKTPNGVGGKYFIGNFDGKNFQAESPVYRLGGNFFVGQSFTDMPANDGRRIWMGWKWLKGEGSFGPWTGGVQTVPVELSLGAVGDDELRLFYYPARELKSLRTDHFQFRNEAINEKCSLLTDQGIRGELFECIVEFQLDSAEEFGLQFRKGAGGACVVGYNTTAKKIVFRDAAGNEKISQPLTLQGNTLKLHLLLDRSVVEIFGGNGQTWNCAFFRGDPKNKGVELYARKGVVKLDSLNVWRLKSIWQ